MVEKTPIQSGKEKIALSPKDIDVKKSLPKSREKIVREMAGWLTPEEAEELRRATKVFNRVDEGDWD